MKLTIQIDAALYRRLKEEAARQGLAVKELVVEGVRRLLEMSAPPPPWFGALRAYAKNAAGRHDLASMRRSIARGRRRGN